MDWIWPVLGFSLVGLVLVVSAVVSARRRIDKPRPGGLGGRRGTGPDVFL